MQSMIASVPTESPFSVKIHGESFKLIASEKIIRARGFKQLEELVKIGSESNTVQHILAFSTLLDRRTRATYDLLQKTVIVETTFTTLF